MRFPLFERKIYGEMRPWLFLVIPTAQKALFSNCGRLRKLSGGAN
jgi:hypothetical protein